MTRRASGSIHVVTNVARLRIGMPVEDELLAEQAHRVRAAHAVVGQARCPGASSSRKRLPYRSGEGIELLAQLGGHGGSSLVSSRPVSRARRTASEREQTSSLR